MIVTPYVAKSTGIKFGKICLSHPSRCRGVRGQAYLEIYSKSTPFFPSEMSSFMNSPSVGRSGNETIVLSMRVIRRLQYIYTEHIDFHRLFIHGPGRVDFASVQTFVDDPSLCSRCNNPFESSQV